MHEGHSVIILFGTTQLSMSLDWTIISELGDWFNNIAVLALAMHLTGSGWLSRRCCFLAWSLLFVWTTSRRTGGSVQTAHPPSRCGLHPCGLAWFLLVSSRAHGAGISVWCVLTAVSIFFTTAKNASIPELCTPEELMTANALTGSTTAIMQMLGGALGGFAVQGFGYRAAFTLNRFRSCFGRSHSRIRFPNRSVGPASKPSYAVSSWRAACAASRVLGLLLVGVGWATGSGAARILFSLFAVGVAMPVSGIGVLYSAAGFGIVVGNYIQRVLSSDLQVTK
jgi:hypothetical protein